MGGRGSFASGDINNRRYVCVGYIHGVKVLEGLNGIHKLPEESNSSGAYIRLDRNGRFYQYREYTNHKVSLEIGYHPESKIDKSGKPVLHVHEYSNDMLNRTTRAITQAEIEKYKKFFKGIKL